MGFADRFGGGKKEDANSSSSGETSGSTSGSGSGAAGTSTGNSFANKFAAGRGPASSPLEKKDTSASFADQHARKNPQSFTDQVTRRGDLVYLVHGKDRNRDAWHYVLVDKPKLPMFLKQIETGSIDVALFGEVLRSGWGKNPPDDVVKAIEEEFG